MSIGRLLYNRRDIGDPFADASVRGRGRILDNHPIWWRGKGCDANAPSDK